MSKRFTKGSQMINKKGSKSGHCSPLTKTQKDVLRLISVEYLTPPKIANLRGTTRRAVYKTIEILKKKGILNYQYKKVHNLRGTTIKKGSQKIQQIRLHGQEFNIKIIKKGLNYNDYVTKSSTILLDSNTIRLYSNSIEVYSGKDFFSDDVGKATSKSFEYWNRFFIRLENELDVLIVKDRHKNINLVKHHYAYTNNPLAKEMNETDVKIRLYSTEDNKLWFEIDNSWNLNEAETVHKGTAKQDMQNIIQPFFNDLRDNFEDEVPTISKILESINQIAKQNLETAQGLNAVVKLIKPSEPKDLTSLNEIIKLDYIG